jgi:PPM family protein phosphatase
VARLFTAAASHRAGSEDRLDIVATADASIVTVADGTGGISGGALAAEHVTAGVRARVLAASPVSDPASWASILEQLDREIADDRNAGETTAVALAIFAGEVVGASVGDSRAYLVTPSGAVELTSAQRRKPRLGTGRATAVGFRAPAEGVLVVGTDGLFDYAKLDDIVATLGTPDDDPAAALVDFVRRRHPTLPDDMTVVVGWF